MVSTCLVFRCSQAVIVGTQVEVDLTSKISTQVQNVVARRLENMSLFGVNRDTRVL